MVEVVAAHEPPLLDDARRLMRAYAASLPFDLAFQGFEAELAGLPGDYAPPRGALLVARAGERSLGCVALRPLAAGTAELKRLWVRPTARGSGAGRRLVEAALAHARSAGYARVRLDTTPGMGAAQALYRSLGFVEIPPYRPNPVPGTTYLELALDPPVHGAAAARRADADACGGRDEPFAPSVRAAGLDEPARVARRPV